MLALFVANFDLERRHRDRAHHDRVVLRSLAVSAEELLQGIDVGSVPHDKMGLALHVKPALVVIRLKQGGEIFLVVRFHHFFKSLALRIAAQPAVLASQLAACVPPSRPVDGG